MVKGTQEWKANRHSFLAWKGNHRTDKYMESTQNNTRNKPLLSRDYIKRKIFEPKSSHKSPLDNVISKEKLQKYKVIKISW